MAQMFGWVYEIYDIGADNVIYVGSTTNLQARIVVHRDATNNVRSKQYDKPLYRHMRENGGFNRFQFRTMWRGDVQSRAELCIREQELIDVYGMDALFNRVAAVKDPVVARELGKRRSSARYYANRATINRYITCEGCGFVVTYNNKSGHLRSEKHRTYEQFALVALFE